MRRHKKSLQLKKKDFTVWVIWTNGIFPRLLEALVSTNSSFDKDEIEKYLDKGNFLLTNPDNVPVWGEDLFKYRKAEIRKSKNILKKLAVVVAAIIVSGSV